MAKDSAGEWLKENDPNFKNRNRLEYPYLTGRQIREKSEIEIPVSSLSFYFVQEWTGMDEEQLKEVQDLFT